MIRQENSSLTKQNFTDLKKVNATQIKLDKNPAYKYEFTAKLKPVFGDFGVNAMDILTIKDKKQYDIQYISETANYSSFFPTLQRMIDSFRILNNTLTTNSRSNTSVTEYQTKYLHTFSNATIGIEIKYPYNWQKIVNSDKRISDILFFSRIDGPYLIQSQYGISINEPSLYRENTDFLVRLIWDDTVNNKRWAKQVEEISPGGQSRVVDESYNSSNDFKTGQPYILLPLDLRTINSPNQYLMIFSTELVFIKDGHLCDLTDASSQVSNPPPKFVILTSSNSSTIGPGQTKNIQLTIKSFSDIPIDVTFSTDYSNPNLPVNATFSPREVLVRPSGWATTELTIKDSWWNAIYRKSSITDTLRIIANIVFYPNVLYSGFNTTIPVAAQAGITRQEFGSLVLTGFNVPDYLFNIWNTLSTPINGFVGVIGAIIGILGTLFVKRSTKKNDSGNGGANRSA